MTERKYDFDIVFRRLKEAKEEQAQIQDYDLIVSEEIHAQIRELRECYEDASQEVETYTRS